jgi:hypothetical protein
MRCGNGETVDSKARHHRLQIYGSSDAIRMLILKVHILKSTLLCIFGIRLGDRLTPRKCNLQKLTSKQDQSAAPSPSQNHTTKCPVAFFEIYHHPPRVFIFKIQVQSDRIVSSNSFHHRFPNWEIREALTP